MIKEFLLKKLGIVFLHDSGQVSIIKFQNNDNIVVFYTPQAGIDIKNLSSISEILPNVVFIPVANLKGIKIEEYSGDIEVLKSKSSKKRRMIRKDL